MGCRGSNWFKFWFWCWSGFTRVNCSSRSIDFRLFVSEPAWLFTPVSLPTRVTASRIGEALRGGSIVSIEGTGLRLGFALEKASKGEMESKNDLLGRGGGAGAGARGAADGFGKKNGGAGSGPSKLPSCSLCTLCTFCTFCIGGDTLVGAPVFLTCELRGTSTSGAENEFWLQARTHRKDARDVTYP